MKCSQNGSGKNWRQTLGTCVKCQAQQPCFEHEQSANLGKACLFTATPRGNFQILSLSDHFTRWRNVLLFPKASAETIADWLEEWVFHYLIVLERIHTDLKAQFELKLMAELWVLWVVSNSYTTPYNPQTNRMVERGNRDLGDMLKLMLFERNDEDWNLLLKQTLRIIWTFPHKPMAEPDNYLIVGLSKATVAPFIYS